MRKYGTSSDQRVTPRDPGQGQGIERTASSQEQTEQDREALQDEQFGRGND